VSTGLVLDKNGNKMSKRLGNAIDPFDTLSKYGADPTRWYMITNAQPWDNLKFDLAGITEVRNKFFGTLTNTYNFFALYANLDGFAPEANGVTSPDLTELDRWILSKLSSLVAEVDEAFAFADKKMRSAELLQYIGNGQVTGFPTTIFWTNPGKDEKRYVQPGYLPPADFITLLDMAIQAKKG
jgi:isoleucyl-tRNA synthetase